LYDIDFQITISKYIPIPSTSFGTGCNIMT